MSRAVDHSALAAELRDATPADPCATARALGRITARASRGNRLDDVVRGRTTVATGLWLLARLVAQGFVTVGVDGWVSLAQGEVGEDATLGGSAAPDALIDAAASRDLVDWCDVSAVISSRPFAPDPAWFQSFDTLASLQRRLAVMEHFNDLSGASVLQLGDDELFGLVLGMVDDIRRVHVVDADPVVLRYLTTECARRGLSVTVQQADLRNQRPSGENFDTFYVSGLKDAGGLLLFTAAGIAAARPGAAGYISFDTAVYRAGMSESGALRDLHRIVGRLDCTVTAQLPCEDRLMDDEMLESLAALVNGVASPGVTVAAVADQLHALAGGPRPDPFYLKAGFPAIPLRSAGLLRIVCGAESRRLALRHLAMLQGLRTDAPASGSPLADVAVVMAG
ncbi:MAG: bis-aminopropyl spermidine synthase family protein [Frankiaceae bacterium]